jgi:AraC family transcriptional regulator
MAMTSELLARGRGWQVSDLVCDAGPSQGAFEERHESVCIAAVTQGTFQYRSPRGSALLSPGSFLLGNAAECFECGHEYDTGDRCLSFHFAPDLFETIVSAVPKARSAAFAIPRLPPLPSLVPLLSAAERARDRRDAMELEEVGLRLAGAVLSTLATGNEPARRPSRRDEERVTHALRTIEAAADETLTLAALADDAAMSPYHFLRTFRDVVGMTPHRAIIHARLRRAAARLSASETPISTIAFDAGFGDLSTFNGRFRKVFAATPSAYRAFSRDPRAGSACTPGAPSAAR